MALLVLLECSISNSVVTDFSEIIRPGLGCIISQISSPLHPQMRMCFLPSSDVTSIISSFRLVVNRSHFSSIPDLKVAAPGVLVSPVALSRVRLTPEIKAAHSAQFSRTSAHQHQKVTSSRHPSISILSSSALSTRTGISSLECFWPFI